MADLLSLLCIVKQLRHFRRKEYCIQILKLTSNFTLPRTFWIILSGLRKMLILRSTSSVTRFSFLFLKLFRTPFWDLVQNKENVWNLKNLILLKNAAKLRRSTDGAICIIVALRERKFKKSQHFPKSYLPWVAMFFLIVLNTILLQSNNSFP